MATVRRFEFWLASVLSLVREADVGFLSQHLCKLDKPIRIHLLRIILKVLDFPRGSTKEETLASMLVQKGQNIKIYLFTSSFIYINVKISMHMLRFAYVCNKI